MRREPWVRRAARRALTIPAYTLTFLVTLAGLPVLCLLALAFDGLGRRRLAATRMLGFFVSYLACEIAGLLAAFAIWAPRALRLVDRERFHDWNFRLQCLWAGALFGSARRLYGLQIRVEGSELVLPGPVLVFARHASLIDTLLPAVLISAPHGLRLRYVLKRELLLDPCLDVVGGRLPNVFVRRDAVHSQQEIEAVRELARGLSSREGVLIFPEGTRFTPARRERALVRLAASSTPELAERAARLRHVLPPRLGGPLALLEACPEADVLLCAHTGLEGLTRPRHFWDGKLLGRSLEVRFFRVPAASLPRDRAGRIDWLYGLFEELDAWIETRRGAGIPFSERGADAR